MGHRRGLVLALAFASLFSAAAAAQPKGPAPFGSLVQQILAFFPPLTGEVVEVKGKELILSLGRREGVQTGMEFSLFREGRELRHPKTGELLGHVEEELGLVVVSRVSETYSAATGVSGVGIRPGDRVRISAGKIKLTLTALASPGVAPGLVEAVFNRLAEELGTTGRFQVLNGDALAAAAGQAGIPPERIIQGEGLAEPAGRQGVRHLLVLWIKPVQTKPFVEARLFSFLQGREGTPMVSAGVFVPAFLQTMPGPTPRAQFSSAPESPSPSRPAEESPRRGFLARLFFGDEEKQPEEPGGTVSMPFVEVARLEFPVLAMDVAVSPKDQIPRLVATDGERVYLYKIRERALVHEWTYAVHATGTIISVQLADLDGDGILEVVANRYSSVAQTPLTSFILASRDGKASVLAEEASQILFAVDATGAGVKGTLWVQRFDPESFFAQGKVQGYSLRNGKLVADSAVRVPKDFRVMSATLCNILGSSPRALVYVDEQNHFVVATDAKEKWRSSSRVGGAGYLRLEVSQRTARTGQTLFYSVEPMPLAVDLDGDGVDEILIPQGEVAGTIAVLSRSRTGYRVQTLTTGFEETVTGLGAIRGATPPTLVVASVEFAGVAQRSGETRILMGVLK